MNPCSSSTFVAPCWRLQVTHDVAEANMKLSGDCSKQSVTLSDGNMKVPYLMNHVKISDGDAIVLFREAPPKAQKVPEVLGDVKRRKVGKNNESS